MSAIGLKGWLSSLGLNRLRKSIDELGVTSPQDLSLLSATELDVVLTELKLKPIERIKITLSIRKFELAKFKHTVVITPEEDKAMKQLNNTTAEAQKLLKKVQETVKATQNSSSKAREAIVNEFKLLDEALKRRKKELLGLLKRETAEKTNCLNNQSMRISSILSQCTQATLNSNKLLNISDVSQLSKREADIRSTITGVLNAKIDTDPVVDPEIMFLVDSNLITKMVSSLGDIVSGALTSPPNITKLEAVRNTVQISWEPEIPNLEPGVGESLKRGNIFKYSVKISDHEAKCAEGEVVWEKEAVCEAKQKSHTFDDLKPEHLYAVRIRAMNYINKPWGNFGTFETVKTDMKRRHFWDPSKKGDTMQISGNQLTKLVSSWQTCLSKTVFRSGKHCFEIKVLRMHSDRCILIGIAPETTPSGNQDIRSYLNTCVYYTYDGKVYHDKTNSANGTKTLGAGVVFTVTVDMDNKTIQFAENGKQFPQVVIKIPGPICPAVALHYEGDTVEIY